LRARAGSSRCSTTITTGRRAPVGGLPQPFGAQEASIRSDPERFFRPPYVGPSGWVGVVLDTGPDWREVARLVREAYMHVASTKLRNLAVTDGASPRP
jgi:hypothetical protein